MDKFVTRFAVILFTDGKLDWIALEDTIEAAKASASEWATNNPGAGTVAIQPVEVVFESFIE